MAYPLALRPSVISSLLPTFQHQACHLSSLQSKSDIAAYLSKPSWSVRSTLSPTKSQSSTSQSEITSGKLHHLLRLSALPVPKTQAEEDKLINDLQRQLHFVQAIQAVDTHGVEPLVAIRDETQQGIQDSEIGLDDPDIKRALGRERTVGRRGRIVTIQDDSAEVEEASMQEQKWDPLERAGRRVGRYIAIDTAND